MVTILSLLVITWVTLRRIRRSFGTQEELRRRVLFRAFIVAIVLGLAWMRHPPPLPAGLAATLLGIAAALPATSKAFPIPEKKISYTPHALISAILLLLFASLAVYGILLGLTSPSQSLQEILIRPPFRSFIFFILTYFLTFDLRLLGGKQADRATVSKESSGRN